ncbi:hypothetical protein AOLI_G00113740 [Acnodon oligacanthus]
MFFSGVTCVWRLETAAKADRQAPKPTARLKPTREHVAAAETLTQRADSEETSSLIATLLPLGVREGGILWTGRNGSEQNGTSFPKSGHVFFWRRALCSLGQNYHRHGWHWRRDGKQAKRVQHRCC